MTRYLLDTNHVGTLLRDANAPLWSKLRTLSRFAEIGESSPRPSDAGFCKPRA